jgi:hypothetical protein
LLVHDEERPRARAVDAGGLARGQLHELVGEVESGGSRPSAA